MKKDCPNRCPRCSQLCWRIKDHDDEFPGHLGCMCNCGTIWDPAEIERLALRAKARASQA